MDFFFCYLSKWECNTCCTLSLAALEVYPTMTTFASEKPRNVKKVYGDYNCQALERIQSTKKSSPKKLYVSGSYLLDSNIFKTL